jgi:hypothetical protein
MWEKQGEGSVRASIIETKYQPNKQNLGKFCLLVDVFVQVVNFCLMDIAQKSSSYIDPKTGQVVLFLHPPTV